MCSTKWVAMLTPDDFGLSPNHYRIVDQTLIEKWPTICPNQHPLGRQNCLVGNHPCVTCTGSSHRTWQCVFCDACWIWPACRDRPEWPVWTGDDS